ncbi:MAG TPA: DUF4157 domain-containing protein, partial [Caldilineaceae bacterium]|nr:DUF4157 domain-containing protein [Caldilineaceae bacterium]
MTDKVRAGPIETPKRRADRAAAQQKAQDGPDQRAGRQRVHGALGNHALSTLLSGNAPAPGGAPSSVEALHAALRQAQQGRHPASGRAAQPLQRSQPPGEALNFQVSKPADPAERAAEATAQRLLQGAGASERPAPVVDRTTPPAPAPTTGQGVPAPTATTIRNPRAGQPLSPLLRHQLETPLRMELSAVRVHSGPGAAEAARSLGARAFTHGSDIFLGPGESAQDTRLIAHEVTHVVQQTSAPAATPGIQRDLADDLASAAGAVADLGSSAVDTVSEAAGEVVEMGAEYFWSLVEELAPQFAPILREISDKGILTYFGDLIRESFGSIFDSLSADPGVIGALTSTFLELFASAQTILTALASGDCGPLFAAVTQLKETVSQMAGDAWNAITEFFQPVGDFFSNLWQQFGAPLVDWLTAMAGDLWEWIQNLGTQIWEWTAPVRDTLMAAWEWVTEQLFGHEDPQGNSEGGLVNLITDMAGQAWDAIKAEVEPVIAPIRSFAESVMALLPLDAILNLRETVQGWLSGVQNMTQNMSQPQDVATNQGSLREILPGVLASIATLRDGIVAAGQWVATQVGSVAETVNGFFASLSSISLLSPLSGAISWVQETVTSLSSWAQETVAGLFTSIGDGLVYLSQFIEPVVSK